MERKTFFADVILPLSLEGTFTYRIPHDLANDIALGKRVVVQFGAKKIYTALVYKIHENAPQAYSVKYVLSVLDVVPIVNPKQLELWEWMSFYYCCHLGEVMNAALPSAFKLASETKIVLNPQYEIDIAQLSDKEYLIVEALTINKMLTLTEVSKILEQLKVFPVIKTLIEKGAVLLEEELTDKYKARTESFLRLAHKYKDEQLRIDLFYNLNKRAFKQLEILMAHQILTKEHGDIFAPVSKKVLCEKSGVASSVLSIMIKKGIFVSEDKRTSRLPEYKNATTEIFQLNESQQLAFDEIKKGFEENDIVLLHGVASSGKTEIYVKLIKEYIEKGKQVLYLLPEIALTTQMITRLRRFFGNDIGVYHSKFSSAERLEIWHAVLKDGTKEYVSPYKIILGARSALFLPYSNLGLIIIDEEHDTSYKQYNPPRYHARDTALYMSRLHDCKALLGTATPAIESYYNTQIGKSGLISLKQRYGNLPLPQIQIVDVKDLVKKRAMKSIFSPVLLDAMKETLEKKEQVILFQNRRGFALWLECQSCAYIPMCKYCDVTLTYHKKENRLRCHYCGYNTKIPNECPACKTGQISLKSYGTQRVEDELKIFFPNILVGRLDFDSTRAKNAFQDILDDFSRGKINMLVGTQMLSKGLSFDNVGLVGILNADNMLSFPDFRSFERGFQMLTQVCGRSGRKFKQGKVILQTYKPSHFVIEKLLENDYSGFYQQQLSERHRFFYPPFSRLILVSLKHRNMQVLNNAASFYADNLRLYFKKNILGPEFPFVGKIKNEFIKNILIKVDKAQTLAYTREIISKQNKLLRNQNEYKSVKISIDVDPI